MDQIHRRIILEEAIPHNKKLFSLFNPFTEWLSKGKAGVPVELGLHGSISTDQHGFIPAVESNINALECHALDRCPDRGIENFRQYILMSVLAHYIHNIGALVQTKLLQKERRCM